MSGVIFVAALVGGAGSKWFSHRFLLGLFLLLSLAAAILIMAPAAEGRRVGVCARRIFDTGCHRHRPRHRRPRRTCRTGRVVHPDPAGGDNPQGAAANRDGQQHGDHLLRLARGLSRQSRHRTGPAAPRPRRFWLGILPGSLAGVSLSRRVPTGALQAGARWADSRGVRPDGFRSVHLIKLTNGGLHEQADHHALQQRPHGEKVTGES